MRRSSKKSWIARSAESRPRFAGFRWLCFPSSACFVPALWLELRHLRAVYVTEAPLPPRRLRDRSAATISRPRPRTSASQPNAPPARGCRTDDEVCCRSLSYGCSSTAFVSDPVRSVWVCAPASGSFPWGRSFVRCWLPLRAWITVRGSSPRMRSGWSGCGWPWMRVVGGVAPGPPRRLTRRGRVANHEEE